MCLISKSVNEVANTELFCGVNTDRTRQITVYANTVDNISTNNAMVLPVPFPKSVQFHNLENYKNFFSDCKKCFSSPKYGTDGGFSITNGLSLNSTLKVYDVGSYKVSIANSLDDLCKVNTNVFELSDGLRNELKKTYSNPVFGFIICKLSQGKEKYHPFAYSHQIANGKVFIPTKHYHEHNKNINNFYNNFRNDELNKTFNGYNADGTFSSVKPNNTKLHNGVETVDEWNHYIYLYNVDINSNDVVKKMNSGNDLWSKKLYIDFEKLDFPLDTKVINFNKIEINGENPNIDLVLSSYS